MKAYTAALAGLLRAHGDADACSGDALLDCFRILLGRLGIDAHLSPPGDAANGAALLARQAGVRLHPVRLKGPWWRSLAQPLLARAGDDGRPLAILPGARTALLVDPQRGRRRCLDAHVAQTVDVQAQALLPCLGEARLTPRAVVRLFARHGRGDWRRLLLAILAAGLVAQAPAFALALLAGRMLPAMAAQDFWLPGVLAGGLGLSALLQGLARNAAQRIDARAGSLLQAALFERLLALPADALRRMGLHAGVLGDILLAAAVPLGQATVNAAQAATGLAGMAGVLCALVWIDAGLAAFALPLLLVAAMPALLRWPMQVSATARCDDARLRQQAVLADLLRGVADVQAAGAEARAFGLWAHARARQQESELAQQAGLCRHAVIDGFVGLCVVLPWILLAEGTVGMQLALLVLTLHAAIALAAWRAGLAGLAQAAAALAALRPLLETPPPATPQGVLPSLAGHLGLHRVHFRYAPQAAPVLQDCSLEILPGECLALAGPSGSGKSTVLRLLAGLEHPQSGAVSIDGEDLSGLEPQALRAAIATVLPHDRLQPGDIYTNIAGPARLCEGALREAVQLAGLQDDIDLLPLGLHTPIGMGAANLSQGQCQRILLARALARKPRILLLDEACNAIDGKTQAALHAHLKAQGVTRVMVTHSAAAWRLADRVAWLEDGRLSASPPDQQ